MVVKEFGKENKRVIMLLHGGGLSWWSFKDVVTLIKSDYHVIIPILDGHANSDRKFTSIEDNANEIINFIKCNYNGQVFMLAGVSLGGQILLEILSKQPDICSYALVESALVLPMKTTHKLIEPTYKLCYNLINKRWFSRLQFNSLKIKKDLFEAYYTDTCKISKADLIAMLKSNSNYSLKHSIRNSNANVLVVVGDKELKIMVDSARKIHQYITKSELMILKGCRHGELSINRADEYVKMLKDLSEKGEH
ncbi:MAG: alpha/beta hydrolase [Acutalibacteraceae bacterium]|nr:alpha/beta hydrolase [Acutalibacteraceae bacterium]